MVEAKVSPHLCFAWDYPVCAIKQSEMAATCDGLGDSQVKPSCESRLAAARCRAGATELTGLGSSLRPAIAYLKGFRKL